jgi:hypothetical protein
VVVGGGIRFFAVFGNWEWGSDEVAREVASLLSSTVRHAARSVSAQKTTGMCGVSSSGSSEFIL